MVTTVDSLHERVLKEKVSSFLLFSVFFLPVLPLVPFYLLDCYKGGRNIGGGEAGDEEKEEKEVKEVKEETDELGDILKMISKIIF